MKATKLTLILALLGISQIAISQQVQHANMNFNNVSANISNNGVLFADSIGNSGGYEFPKDSGKKLIYSSGIWMSGTKADGTIMSAASSYPSLNRDLFPGPIGDSYTGANYIAKYNKSIWQLEQESISRFRTYWSACNPNSPNASTADCAAIPNSELPTNEVISVINQWPANGDWMNNNERFYLAPFWNMDGGGSYDPDQGDYPLLKGCSGTYMMLNDDAGTHQITGGNKFGVEVHYQMYQFDTPGFLENTTFVRVDVVNPSLEVIHNFKLGFFMDGDLGNPSDDFIGCDVNSDMMYFYNSDNIDESVGPALGYGSNPPAFGVVSLNRPISSVVSFQNSYPYAMPITAYQYMNFLSGVAADGSPLTNNLGQTTTFHYSGDPSSSGTYSETGQMNSGGDRRGLMSINLGEFQASVEGLFTSIARFDFAIVTSNSGTNIQNATNLIGLAQQVKDFYLNGDLSCGSASLGTEENELITFDIFPNPANELINIVSTVGNKTFSITNTLGQIVKIVESDLAKTTVGIEELKAGAYFISLEKDGVVSTELFIKN